MTNLQAAVGLAQLERLDEFVEKKRAMGKRYTELLADVPSIRLPLAKTDYSENIYWVYGVVLEDEIRLNSEEAIKRLAKKNIGCRPFFCPMHQQPVLKRLGLFENEEYPGAEYLYRKGFYVPSGIGLTKAQMDRVALAVREVVS